MHIREFQELMKTLYFKRDEGRGFSKIFMWIVEEIGELAEALRKYQEHNEKNEQALKNVEMEMADIIAWVASLANVLGIDLETAMYEKYPDVCPKCRKNPCCCDTE
ncbi:MAG: nucleotide pyrophosphohydrolase [Candidatus Helarchaeota archaeon]|nr:nucleotide pyrophosphohydrolase [Candidatus Helarchaeota archaeon]